jgi:hypothetical protein
MWDSVFLDFLYLSTDYMTGKTLPVLIAVTVFSLDPHLLGTMVLLGAGCGALINWVKASRMPKHLFWDLALRFMNLSFASVVSICVLVNLFKHIHPLHGAVLGVIPAFWVVLHGMRNSRGECMSERSATLTVLVACSSGLFYLGLLAMLAKVDHGEAVVRQAVGAEVEPAGQRALLAMSRMDWYTHYYKHDNAAHKSLDNSLIHVNTQSQVHQAVSSGVPACLCVLVSMAYATVVHGPLYQYTGRFCSPTFLYNRSYAFMVCVSVAVFRAYIILTIGWLQTNAVHVVLESTSMNASVAGIVLVSWWYIAVVLLSLSWNTTQVVNQVLSLVVAHPDEVKLRYLIVLFTLGYMVYYGSYQCTHLAVFVLSASILQLVLMSLEMAMFQVG